MLGNNQEIRNRKPRSESEAQPQGMEGTIMRINSNYTKNWTEIRFKQYTFRNYHNGGNNDEHRNIS